MALLMLSAFMIGALTVVVMEVVGLWILIRSLNRKVEREEIKAKDAASVSSPGDLNPSLYDKQEARIDRKLFEHCNHSFDLKLFFDNILGLQPRKGINVPTLLCERRLRSYQANHPIFRGGAIWILEPDKVTKLGLEDKGPTDQKRKKEIMEVTPVRKYARIRDHYLILMESGGSCVEILLRGCTIVAVSATSLSSRKWAKRYPIKVESKDSAIYKGYKIIYIYLETSWEKESWCKALRLASCDDEDKLVWFSRLGMEFHNYLASLNAGYPQFMKPSAGSNAELIDKSVKLDNSSSKVRQFLKKLARKASKTGQDYKASGASISGHEERRISEKSRSFQDLILTNDLAKLDQTGKLPKMSFDDTSMASSISTSTVPGTGSHLSEISDADSNHKCFDEGTLCLNVIVSRLFFDAKNNNLIRSSIQNRIQRALANMRIPSYIGEVTCTSLDLGTLPPHILAMRVLPSNINEVWSLEIDVEYMGGMVLDFETRLEIRELELEEEETRFGTNTAGEVTSGLLEGFEHLGEQLKLYKRWLVIFNKRMMDIMTQIRLKTPKALHKHHLKGLDGSPYYILSPNKCHRFVSLSLGIRVSSLSGTIRLCMKPPPSDQIWFGFTSMPDIQFNLESFVGDHKITNGHLALFLISRFKAAIRETLVLPNSESVGIPWMLAEKDDWVPRKVAPFMWYKNNQDSVSNTTKHEVACFPGEVPHTAEANHGNSTRSEVNHEKSKIVGPIPEGTCESLDPCASSSSSIDESIKNDSSFQELRAPLLKKDKTQEFGTRSIEDKPDSRVNSPSRNFTEGQIHNSEDDDTRPRRIGTKERMRGLGKKMGEKIEVKRRHFEEKGRSFVERMRGP
ncbi:hypothetical protein DH2020_019056 [Rehmannia glutinosa]|uniref:SMP-LTD domain-containing protein n=1 Tax=Rehmannia glutinosa TaxID=99300 RepID=A0ABR0WPR0_REHGL